jgi:hypothetical protein
LDVPTRSSNRAPNARARLSLLFGVVATAALPVGVVLARETERLELLDAGWALPVAAVAGLAAVSLARSARRRIERTIGRAGGSAAARSGRFLGALGLATAASGGIALALYAYLITS